MRAVLVAVLMALGICLIVVVLLLAAVALAVVDVARFVLGDRITRRGNQLLRMAQRIAEANGKLEAALRIGLERIITR